MLDTIDHVGYLARELESSIRQLCARLSIAEVRRFERPRLGLIGAFLGAGTGTIELFSFTDGDLQRERLGPLELILDHVAYEVGEIVAVETQMRTDGVRFCTPDQREELSQPLELAGSLHLWTARESTCGQSIQLLQRQARP